ncbi:DUF3131 domain-containing protein [Nostoc commune]|uniref:DUF3131 domain-containing protein n=1 Tax=Nostoc commune TaxID=1178 RepID=UPI002ED7D5E6
MWDQTAAIAALVSARELNIVPAAEFDAKMTKMLNTLASMPNNQLLLTRMDFFLAFPSQQTRNSPCFS